MNKKYGGLCRFRPGIPVELRQSIVSAGVIFLLVALSCLSFNNFQRNLTGNLESSTASVLQESSQNHKLLFSAKLSSQFSTLEGMATYFSILPQNNPIETEMVLKAMVDSGEFYQLALSMSDGQSYITPTPPGQESAQKAFMAEIANNSRISSPLVSVSGDSSIVVFSVPIKDEGITVGVLRGMYENKTLQDMLLVNSFHGQSSTVLAKPSGEIVASAPASRHLFSGGNIFDMLSSVSLKNGLTLDKIRSDFKRGLKRSIAFSAADVEMLASYQPVGINDWYLVCLLPSTVVNDQRDSIAHQSYLLLVKLAIIAFLLVIWFLSTKRRHARKMGEAHSQLLNLTTNAPCGIQCRLLNQALTLKTVSNSFLEMVGYSRDELEKFNNSYLHFIHTEDIGYVNQSLSAQLQEKSSVELEYRLVKKNGEIIWVLDKGHLTIDGDDRVFYCTIIDISQYRKIRDQLSVTNQELAALANSVDGAVAKLANDQYFTLVYANDGYYNMLGCTRAEMEEIHHFQSVDFVCKDDLPEMSRQIASQLAVGDAVRLEFRVITRDGSYAWWLLNARIVPDVVHKNLFLCVIVDVTDQKKVQHELEINNERYKIATELSDIVIFEYDIQAGELTFSDNFQTVFGIPQAAAIKNRWRRLILREDLPDFKKAVNFILDGGEKTTCDARIKSLESGYIWCQFNMISFCKQGGSLERIIGRITNIDNQKRENELLKEKAFIDPLTCLYNKATVENKIRDFLLQTHDTHALLIIDIDHFKNANDRLGHQYGDDVLHETGRLLESLFAHSGFAGRIGGDEFIVLIKNCGSEKRIVESADLLCCTMRGMSLSNQAYRVSVSVGVAIFPNHGSTYQELFSSADEALYDAKRQGRDRYFICDK